MRSRFTTIVAVGALLGAGPLISPAASADADDTGYMAGDHETATFESEPELRIIERKPEYRIHVEEQEPGHFERQQVLVRKGHYETYNVWVPTDRKGLFGLKKIPGHYEARQRWVEPLYEHQQVWVPER